MATPISQFDLGDFLTKIIDAIENVFDFFPGIESILDSFGIDPENITLTDLFTAVAVLVSLILMVGILYSIIRVSQLRSTDKMVKRKLSKRREETVDNKQWKKIIKLAHNDNPHDWKLAIREADILLDVVVTDRGYRGTTFEERLITMPDSEDAELAHDAWVMYVQKGGDEHMLTKGKTKEILKHYEKALRKLGNL